MIQLRSRTARKKIIPLSLLLGLLLMMFSGGAVLAASGASNTSPLYQSASPPERPVQNVFETTGNIVSLANPEDEYVDGTSLIDISGLSDYNNYDSITDGTVTVDFSQSLGKRTVPDNWATWSSPPYSETAYPDLMYSSSVVTLSLSEPVGTFGFELEPNLFGSFNFTVKYYSNGNLLGSIKRTATGDHGARLFAAQTKTYPIDEIVISYDGSPSGFCIGQFRYVIPGMKVNVVRGVTDDSVFFRAKYYAGPILAKGYKVGFLTDGKFIGSAYTDANGVARLSYDVSDLDPGLYTVVAKCSGTLAQSQFPIPLWPY